MSDNTYGGPPPQFGERATYGPNDVCYRHRDRPTFTLCQRCGNNICTDCQTSSAVGVLCPDCMKAATPGAAERSGRFARRTGRMLAESATPVVTYGIMIACALVFVGQLVIPQVTTSLWYAPAYSTTEHFQPWRMLTVMFTHSTGSYFHILGNMFALWLFGREIERWIGRLRFFILYVLAGWGGSLFVMLWVYINPESIITPTVGASGAIFGVMGATLVGLRMMNANITSLVVLLVINFAVGLQPNLNISWQAHLGGFIVGAVVMALLMKYRGPRHRSRAWIAVGAIAAVLVALSCAYLVVDPLARFLG